MLGRVPFLRLGQKLAVAVAAGDVGQDDRPAGPGLVDRLAAAIDDAVALELLEHLLQPDPVAAVDAEGARDLALADLPGALAMKAASSSFEGRAGSAAAEALGRLGKEDSSGHAERAERAGAAAGTR